MNSGYFNNAEQFSIDVSLQSFYNTEKIDTINFFLLVYRMCLSRNGRWIFIMPLDFYRLA